MKKSVTKKSQKQKQSQKVIVNISHPRRAYKRRASTVSKEQPKQYLPMMPSFNVNQPQQATDLAKLVGLLIPKIQTESTLAKAIPMSKVNINKPTEPEIGGLKSSVKESSLPEAINNKIQEGRPIYDKPKFPNPYYAETEAEAVPLIQAEAKVKRKYVRSGKFKKQKEENPLLEEQPEEP